MTNDRKHLEQPDDFVVAPPRERCCCQSTAPVAVRTFIIGVGSPTSLDSTTFNLQNFPRAGNTNKSPYVLDETAGADAVQAQLVNTLLNISNSALACEYRISPPDPGWVVDLNQVAFTYQPNVGVLQKCPCTCANFGAGRAAVVYGCKPFLEYP